MTGLIFTQHAIDRMIERDISFPEVDEALALGFVRADGVTPDLFMILYKGLKVVVAGDVVVTTYRLR